jgi:eukaryotic-like serine/threonine-protein kinase
VAPAARTAANVVVELGSGVELSHSPLSDELNRIKAGLADQYRVERELGRGGMASVWLAHDLKHDRKVAIKVIRPELAAALGGDRFLREIRIAAHLQHPHILTLIDSGEIPAITANGSGSLYYVMPYLKGETLRARLQREGKLSAAETIRILQGVLDALIHAHNQGIVHRDLKPENIMLTGRHAMVMDFGVAKALVAGQEGETSTLTALGLAVGTPAYMAPEQAAGQSSIDARADVYAIGVLAYEMLTGQPPFTGTTPQAILASQVTRTPTPLGQIRPDLSPELIAIITRCLEKDPDQRWPSAEALLAQLERILAGTTRGRGLDRRRIGVVAALLVLLAAGIWLGPVRQMRDRRWAREQIPRILSLTDAGKWEPAYQLARRVGAIIPKDSLFKSLRPRFGRVVSIHTEPAGAKVWRKAYDAPDSSWTLLGRAPLDSVLLSYSGGGAVGTTDRLRIEAPGYRTIDLVGLPIRDSLIRLDRDDAIPHEMVRVSGGELGISYPDFGHVKPVRLGDYLMDRFEVSNREFKRFIDNGGYRRREFWEHPITAGNREIPWDQAVARMTDRTGRPGPATWEAGDYLPGQDSYPVGGVSWYEAAAYAKFAGKAIPTVAQWSHAAGLFLSASIIPHSNFSGRGPTAVGRGAVSSFGTYDMAGNVREWCLNAEGENRFILGGGWTDQPYVFTDGYAAAPSDRSPSNGIRLVKYLTTESNLAQAAAPLQRARRDFYKQEPVSDAVFEVYRRMYEYDRGPLDARIIETIDEEDWTRQLVRMNAGYAGDTLLVYLYLPKRGTKPYPVVVNWPGSNVLRDRTPGARPGTIDFIVSSGRAVLLPVFKGTLLRKDALVTDAQDSTIFYRDHVIMWAKDLSRGIDYLETRQDITTANLAFYGVSWGGAMGGLIPAVEPRIKSSVLYVAGLDFEPTRPEVEPINFLPRIKIPTLMINGRYDFLFPLETSQQPMFRLLGTPPDKKRYVVEEGSHFVPRTRLIQETLSWLDKYQPLQQ